MMNLIHWRLAVAVAESGNITRAAELVGITQSGASQAIAQLEGTLGTQIFVRARREVTVTAFGESVIEHARAMLSQLESIRALADEKRGMSHGRIRLGSFPSVITSLLPGLLRSFRQRHPGIEIIVLEGTDEEVEAWLENHAIDLGVVLNPAPERQALILGRDAWVALLPNSHVLIRHSAIPGISMEELVSQPFILATGGCKVNGQSLARQAGLELTNIRVTVRDWSSAIALVREGMGVSLVPESTLPKEMQGFRVIPLLDPIYRDFGLVNPHGRKDLPCIAAFWEYLSKASKQK